MRYAHKFVSELCVKGEYDGYIVFFAVSDEITAYCKRRMRVQNVGLKLVEALLQLYIRTRRGIAEA